MLLIEINGFDFELVRRTRVGLSVIVGEGYR